MLTIALLLSLAADGDGGVPSIVNVDAAKLTGFQKTRWGMSADEIRKLYPGSDQLTVKGQVMVGIEQQVASLDAQIIFAFVGDKLTSASVIFKAEQKGFVGVQQICASVESALQDKYGAAQHGAVGHSQWISASTGVDLICASYRKPTLVYVDQQALTGKGRAVKADDL